MINLRLLQLAKRHFKTFYRHNTTTKFRNLCSNYYQFWAGKTEITGYPFEIIIDPTNICNFRCPLCVTGQNKNARPNGMMPFDDFTRIINEIGKWLYKVRFYSWGEPLLHKDIYNMISYSSKNNIGTEMSTNFYNFSAQNVDNLMDSGLENLIISLDGATKSTYAKYRQGGEFDKIIDNIQTVMSMKKVKKSQFPHVEIQFLVMKNNEHEIEDIKKLANKLGVDRLRIFPITINVKEPNQVRDWLPNNEKWSRYNYQTLEDKIYKKRRRCEWLWRSAVINWDGTISPCCVFEGPKADLGSLKGKTFLEVWNNDAYRASRGIFTQNGKNSSPINTICTSCKGNPKAEDEKQYGLY